MNSEPSLTPTGKTILHRGQSYDIYVPEPPSFTSPWYLKSRHGNCYKLVRSEISPQLLFGVSTTTGMLQGAFTDVSGELESLG